MDVTEGHFHAVLLKNCHKDMKAPITTHDLLYLQNQSFHVQMLGIVITQTIGFFFFFFCYYLENLSLDILGVYCWSSVFQTSLALSPHYSNGRGRRKGRRGKKRKEGTNTEHQCHEPKLWLCWTTQFIKGDS